MMRSSTLHNLGVAFAIVATLTTLSGALSDRDDLDERAEHVDDDLSRFWSYSFSAAEVDGRQILLGSTSATAGAGAGALHAYTHYLVPTLSTTKFGSYSFNVSVYHSVRYSDRERSRESDKKKFGIFITPWELMSSNQTNSPFSRSNLICNNYQIVLSYPYSQNRWAKSPVELCHSNGLPTSSLMDTLEYGNYEGPGVVSVTLTRRVGLNSSTPAAGDSRPRSWQTRGDPTNSSGVEWPPIPADTIGMLTFTFYQDCAEAEASEETVGFRPCSRTHNQTCIDSRLFCNAEQNCVTTLFEIFIETTRPRPRPGPRVEDGARDRDRDIRGIMYDTIVYDESEGVCGGGGGTSHLEWNPTNRTVDWVPQVTTVIDGPPEVVRGDGDGVDEGSSDDDDVGGLWTSTRTWGLGVGIGVGGGVISSLLLIIKLGSLVIRALRASTAGGPQTKVKARESGNGQYGVAV